MTTQVRAAVLNGVDEPFVFEDLELDDIRPDEVLVKITSVGLCHTDLGVQHGDIPAEFPAVVGHEGSGVIEEVGSGVTDLKPGDRVVLSLATCGKCRNCLEGRRAYCEHAMELNFGGRRMDGTKTLKTEDGEPVSSNFFGQSSFATYSIARAADVVKLPEDAPSDIAGPLGCGIQTGAGTVMNSLGVEAGTSVVITGTGAVGLSGIMGAKVAGATTIIAVDILDERLEFAKELGATHVINSKNEDPVEKIVEITDGGADYAMDTTGVPAVVTSLFPATRFGAKIALVGVPRPGSTIELGLISAAGKTVIGAIEGDSVPQVFIPQLLSLYQAGVFPFDKLVTKYPFESLDQAIKDTGSGKAVKAVLVMPDAEKN